MKKWKDYNFDLLKLIYKRDFFSSVTSKWWIALSVKAVWKTNLSIAVWPKKIGKLPTSFKIRHDFCGLLFLYQHEKKPTCFFWNVHWWKCSELENGWRSHFQRDWATELLGQTHPERRDGQISLQQKDLDDSSNLTALLQSIQCKTPSAFHLLLKCSLKGMVPTLNLVGIHIYYSWVQFKDSSKSNGLL